MQNNDVQQCTGKEGTASNETYTLAAACRNSRIIKKNDSTTMENGIGYRSHGSTTTAEAVKIAEKIIAAEQKSLTNAANSP